METAWLTPAEMAAWRTYIETYGDLVAAIERDLAEHRLTLGDYQVLVYLSEADDLSMRMCDLADRLQLSPSGLTRRLDGLVSAGLRGARAVDAGPPGDDGAAHRRRVRGAPPGRPASRRKCAPPHLRPPRRRARSRRWHRSSPPSARGWRSDHAPSGFPQPRRQHRRQGRHRRLRRDRRRTSPSPPLRCSRRAGSPGRASR